MALWVAYLTLLFPCVACIECISVCLGVRQDLARMELSGVHQWDSVFGQRVHRLGGGRVLTPMVTCPAATAACWTFTSVRMGENQPGGLVQRGSSGTQEGVRAASAPSSPSTV